MEIPTYLTKSAFSLLNKWVIDVLIRKKSFLIISAILIFVASVVGYFIAPKKYQAVGKILPSGNYDFGALSLLAGAVPQVLAGLTEGNNISSLLYPDIMNSATIISHVCSTKFFFPDINDSLPLSVREKWNNTDAMLKGFKGLSKVSYSIETGVITFKVTYKDSILASTIATSWLEALNWFLRQRLNTSASENYYYLLGRKEVLLQELQWAEDTLREFILSHRNYDRDPVTRLIYEKLSQEWQTKRTIYTTILTELEQSKIKMVQTLPVVQVLDYPNWSYKVFPRKRHIIFAFVIGMFIIVSITVILEGLKNILWKSAK